ncbi:alpha/beta hydrolase [Vibrio parahaemolyticus]|uniref:alpha/beta hydrolase n=1 Tax=Vibrio parahaemolyticus TaxID=670 RepID=UPI00081A48E5|nr:alpha/beta hydrolase [Vibrio parahaemolyticus]ANZ11931.1 hypothetical protein VpaChn25_A0343 [Vibrio parahaemolyticus]
MTWEFIERKEAFDYIGLNNKSVNEIEQFLHGRVRISAALFSNKKLYLSRQSLIMLASLNEYDQKQVIKEMYFLSSNPSAPSVVRHKRNPLLRIFRTRYPFKNYHYLLTCTLRDGKVVIHDIAFDRQLHGKSVFKHSHQRTQMYHVKKETGKNGEYNGVQNNEEAKLLLAEWDHTKAQVTHQVNTLHATVNGMLNYYEKAATLMGVHTQVAYSEDKPTEYTLFHNPSDNAKLDLIECVYDKTRFTSHNAQHLAAVMKQCAEQGKKVKWTVHSQGAIIFNSALEYVRKKNPSLKLLNQQVVVHAGGENTTKIGKNAQHVGLKINYNKTRTNPFDIVPNIAARQAPLSTSSLVRCCKFLGLVMNGEVTESPHTLPYFGVESYRRQLMMSGTNMASKRLKDIDAYLKNKS